MFYSAIINFEVVVSDLLTDEIIFVMGISIATVDWAVAESYNAYHLPESWGVGSYSYGDQFIFFLKISFPESISHSNQDVLDCSIARSDFTLEPIYLVPVFSAER